MASATSESIAAAQKELESTFAHADLAVADELFSALDVLDGSAALRRSFTDPSREPQARDRKSVV